jgi:hypothetical protein
MVVVVVVVVRVPKSLGCVRRIWRIVVAPPAPQDFDPEKVYVFRILRRRRHPDYYCPLEKPIIENWLEGWITSKRLWSNL